jgi:UDP-glucose 4-epimerase
MSVDKPTTLLFGGAGFIGRHLCCHMQSLGREAIVVSRAPDLSFLQEHAPSIRGLTLDEFQGEREAYLRAADTLIYMASTSVPATNKNQPWMELPENVDPAFRLFADAVDINPDVRVVYLSSGGTVYGVGHGQPVKESERLEPISPYGYGKLAIEECIRFLGRTRNLSYAILRVSNPVGIWQSNPRQGIVSVAFQSVLKGKSLTLYNRGDQVRDFLDADDLVEAICLASDARDQRHKTWNIGSGAGRRISEVVALIEDLSGCIIEKKFVQSRSVDADYSVLDCSAAHVDLGWKTEIPFEESLRRIWQFDASDREV